MSEKCRWEEIDCFCEEKRLCLQVLVSDMAESVFDQIYFLRISHLFIFLFLLSPVRHSKRWTSDYRERLGSFVQPWWEDESPGCALLWERSGELLIWPLPEGKMVLFSAQYGATKHNIVSLMSCTANLKEFNSVIIYSFINLKTSITLFLDKRGFFFGGGGVVCECELSL